MKDSHPLGLRSWGYLVLLGLVLGLLMRAPWSATEPAQGGTDDAPDLINPTEYALVHDTNVTFEWEPLGYSYRVEVDTNDTTLSTTVSDPQTVEGLVVFQLPRLSPGPHPWRAYGNDTGGTEHLLEEGLVWVGKAGPPARAPIYWKTQPNTTYEVLVNPQGAFLNITIDNIAGVAIVANLAPDLEYNFQVDQTTPPPDTTLPVTSGKGTFVASPKPVITFPARTYTYTLQISEVKDPEFTKPLATFGGLSQARFSTGELTEEQKVGQQMPQFGEKYIWRVQGSDGVDHTTGWSATGNFGTGTTNHLAKALLGEWGATLLILAGVLLAALVGGVYLAKDELQVDIQPEYSPEEVLSAPAPGEPGYEPRNPPAVEGGP